ncbi:MAG: hypothetical protein LUD69_05890 [Oscillospiraceae bacterium]|nr:hypothetical protein [Oscillospiraceae bacterium]
MDYELVVGGSLSTKYKPRWIVVDPKTGEVLDDAQGYGYKSREKAHAAYGHKTRDRSKDVEKTAKRRLVAQWCREHEDFMDDITQAEFEACKFGEKLDARTVEGMLEEYSETDLSFTAGDLLAYLRRK